MRLELTHDTPGLHGDGFCFGGGGRMRPVQCALRAVSYRNKIGRQVDGRYPPGNHSITTTSVSAVNPSTVIVLETFCSPIRFDAVTNFRKSLIKKTTRPAGSSVVAKTPSPSVFEANVLWRTASLSMPLSGWCYFRVVFHTIFRAIRAHHVVHLLTVGSATRVTYVRAIRLSMVWYGRFFCQL